MIPDADPRGLICYARRDAEITANSWRVIAEQGRIERRRRLLILFAVIVLTLVFCVGLWLEIHP